MKITIKAYAKINLCLDIKEKLPNGYHEIETIFQSVSLYDTVRIENGKTKNRVSCSEKSISDSDNICYKALVSFLEKAKIDDKCYINIRKKIPLCAGLAGGSADAAAVLRGLNYIYSYPLSEDELLEIGKTLGADVPFCMIGGTLHAGGIGEKLSPLAKMPACSIVIIKGLEKPSTAELYKKMDSIKNYPHPDTTGVIKALNEGNLAKIGESAGNVFELAWGKKIKETKRLLMSYDAFFTQLSGSGPSVFGVFKRNKGRKPYVLLSDVFDELYLCYPVDKGFEIV